MFAAQNPQDRKTESETNQHRHDNFIKQGLQHCQYRKVFTLQDIEQGHK